MLMGLAALFELVLQDRLKILAEKFGQTTGTGVSGIGFRLAAAGILLFLIAMILKKTGFLQWLTRWTIAVNGFLVLVSLGTFLFAMETVLRPVFPPWNSSLQATTLFTEDEMLGWRLRPNSSDMWGGVQVTVNRDGFRGPPCSLSKPAGERRVLCLGDSVTFGYFLTLEQSYPFRLEKLISSQAPAGTSTRVINTGVGGYSPWQELIILRHEGLRYQPDVVILGFVLNDVTEKFVLPRFGGSNIGFQMEHARHPGPIGKLLHQAVRLLRRSSIFNAFQRLYLGVRLGAADIRQAATKMEELNVVHLTTDPDSPLVQRSWEVTLENIKTINDLCRETGCRFLLVVFPYRFQLADVGQTGQPQKVLSDFATEEKIKILDLLPLYAREVGNGLTPRELLWDQSHPTPLGSRLAAEWIAEEVRELLQPPGETGLQERVPPGDAATVRLRRGAALRD